MIQGVLFGIAACMIWGAVYVVPLMLGDYDPLYIALARYMVFGGLSCALAVSQRRELATYTRSDWKTAAALGVIGNIVFYWLLAESCRKAGAPIAGAFTAMIPILVAVIGNMKAPKSRAVPWRSLVMPLLCVFAGMVCLNGTEFIHIVVNLGVDQTEFWTGVACAVAALLIWTWYPLSNARWLLAHPQHSGKVWSTAQGLTLFPAAVVGIGFYFAANGTEAAIGPTPVLFLVLSLFLGIVTSWLGIYCWNLMSTRLPPALGGQMIVFETVFAVIYAHIWRMAWPTWLMTVGMILLLAGVFWSLRVFRRASAPAEA